MPCALVTAMVLIYALWPEPKIPPAPPLPSPNGYDDFVKAGRLAEMIPGDFSQMTSEELRSTLGTNREPLRLVRLGLQRECRVPTENSMSYIDNHFPDLPSIKRLARFLSAEGWFAEVEMRYDAGAQIHIEVIRLGQASAIGGLIIDKLVGIAVENIGMLALERQSHHLTKDACHVAIRDLEEIDLKAEPAATYLERDRQWARNATDTSEFSMWIQSVIIYKSLFPYRHTNRKFTAKLQTADRRRRQLLLTLAARAYELEHGKRPSRAEELVPSVLRAIPKDPETGTNLVLHPTP